ncbi:hypothetical protein QEN19_001892 [Hanseniaspora menglaensis]
MSLQLILFLYAYFSLISPQNVTTVLQDTTTVLTITSCINSACETTSSAMIVSVATVTLESKVTEYTTFCPISSSPTPFYGGNVTTSIPKETSLFPQNATISSEFEAGASEAYISAAGAFLAGILALLM